jgi:hypothetical protein
MYTGVHIHCPGAGTVVSCRSHPTMGTLRMSIRRSFRWPARAPAPKRRSTNGGRLQENCKVTCKGVRSMFSPQRFGAKAAPCGRKMDQTPDFADPGAAVLLGRPRTRKNRELLTKSVLPAAPAAYAAERPTWIYPLLHKGVAKRRDRPFTGQSAQRTMREMRASHNSAVGDNDVRAPAVAVRW